MRLGKFRFLIVGQGAEESWLRANLRHADLPGVLRGEALAEAYANMDLFIFPSTTDTYGNVVLEAMSSGVPAVVTDGGGPRFIVRHGENGYIARNQEEFVRAVKQAIEHPEELIAMRVKARNHALSTSWNHVFKSIYASYEHALAHQIVRKNVGLRPPARIIATPLG